MARKTNCTVNGTDYYRICRKVGKRYNQSGEWVDHYKSFYGSCRSEAEKKYQDYILSKRENIDSNGCLGELIDEWAETIFLHSDLSNNTKTLYLGAYENEFQSSRLAGMPIRYVTALDLQDFYNSSKAAKSTLKALSNFLKRFYKYAELNGIARNITTSVTVPMGKTSRSSTYNKLHVIEVWEDDNLKKLIEGLKGTTLRFLVVLAVNTGARFSELLALTYDDIQDGCIIINKQLNENYREKNCVPKLSGTKTASSNRMLPLSSAVLMEFESHKLIHKKEMLANGYRTNNIFTTGNGTYYYRRNVSRALKRLCNRIGVPYLKFHAFRHTFGTNLSRAGVPIEEAAKLMGHSNINVTYQYYINVEAKRKREAVEKIACFSL